MSGLIQTTHDNWRKWYSTLDILYSCCNMLFLSEPEGACGSMLYPSGVTPAQSYDIICHFSMPADDISLYTTPCEELLKDLPGSLANSQELLAAGGNFGCLWSKDGTWKEGLQRIFCRDDYQHNIGLADCSSCSHLYVCIRLPGEAPVLPTPFGNIELQSDDIIIPAWHFWRCEMPLTGPCKN